MDFKIPAETSVFARELDTLLAAPYTQGLLTELRRRSDGMDGDVRPLYQHLGQHRVLAPSWPTDYGGRDADFTATLVLLERMVQHGIPQSLYYISVQIVGSLVLASGTPEQRKTLLPALASGDLAACILFTEDAHGSELASIQTQATSTGHGDRVGWVLNGRKVWSLKSAYADVALVAARLDDGSSTSQYEAITLFLVPLDTAGVTVRPIRSLADEQFHDITFDRVHLPADAVLGDPGGGWALITRMFAAERSGLDYYARARTWLDLTAERLCKNGRVPSETELAGLGALSARVEAGRLLTCRALQRLQENDPDIAEASLAKWHCSETSQRVAWWAVETVGDDVLERGLRTGDDMLEAAFREAPGMTISGGASEVMLDIVTGARLYDELATY